MTKLVKIVVLGFIALGISACGGSCKSGDVQDEVIKKVKTMYPNSNPKLTNIEMIDSDKEDKSVQCKADIEGVDDKLSVNYTAHNRGDKVSVSMNIHSMVGEIRRDIDAIRKIVVAKVFAEDVKIKTPKAPNGKEWGEWMLESAMIDSGKWAVVQNGISPKDCNKGETPLITIDNEYLYFNPSKIAGEGKMEAFCKGLSESYRNGKGNGDKKAPL